MKQVFGILKIFFGIDSHTILEVHRDPVATDSWRGRKNDSYHHKEIPLCNQGLWPLEYAAYCYENQTNWLIQEETNWLLVDGRLLLGRQKWGEIYSFFSRLPPLTPMTCGSFSLYLYSHTFSLSLLSLSCFLYLSLHYHSYFLSLLSCFVSLFLSLSYEVSGTH